MKYFEAAALFSVESSSFSHLITKRGTGFINHHRSAHLVSSRLERALSDVWQEVERVLDVVINGPEAHVLKVRVHPRWDNCRIWNGSLNMVMV